MYVTGADRRQSLTSSSDSLGQLAFMFKCWSPMSAGLSHTEEPPLHNYILLGDHCADWNLAKIKKGSESFCQADTSQRRKWQTLICHSQGHLPPDIFNTRQKLRFLILTYIIRYIRHKVQKATSICLQQTLWLFQAKLMGSCSVIQWFFLIFNF